MKRSRSSHPEVYVKKEFLKILQNSQKNTCAGVSFEQIYKSKMFSCEFFVIFKNTYSEKHL